MSRCLNCHTIAKHMYEVTERSRPEEAVGLVCHDCKEDFVNGGLEAGTDGTCGFSKTCSESVAYVALVQRTVSTESDVRVVTEAENLLCADHLDRLTAEQE